MLTQQREEYDRLQAEASLLASQLSEALSERDANASTADENGQKLAKSIRENEILNKQLNDLGRQVQGLLKELGRRHDPTIPSDAMLENDPHLQPAQDIDAVITNNLVLFRSIPALQEQNQKLLKIVRELGGKMEAEEKEYRRQMEKEQAAALKEAYLAIKELQKQLEENQRNSQTTIQAYVKERDALKSMLARERAATKPSATGAVAASSEGDTVTELEQVSSQFEVYKTEMTVDTVKLRDELLEVRRGEAHVKAQLSKSQARAQYLEGALHCLFHRR